MRNIANYEHLIHNLDAFIRKYYLNHLIRGALITLAVILGTYVAYNLLEALFYFGTGVRKLLLGSFAGISAASLGRFVLWPVAQYFRLGRVISHEQAARIVGQHFRPVEDKLLNLLQLKQQADITPGSAELLLAGIDQKTREIELVPFKSAVDLSRNRKYLRYALPPLLVLLFLLVAAPSLLRDSTHRLIHADQVFTRNAPFHFVLDTAGDFSVLQYGDFTLSLTTEGEMSPAEVFIEVDHYAYRMRQEAAGTFTYTFKNVQDDTGFRIYSGPVSSDEFTLSVVKKSGIAAFTVSLDYPAYTGRQDEELKNLGDLIVPEGTRLSWDIEAVHTAALTARFDPSPAVLEAEQRGEERFVLKNQALQDCRYTLFLHHAQLPLIDSVEYSLRVVPDRYPGIRVETFPDSTEKSLIYFAGSTDDDYGIRDLAFVYEILDGAGRSLTKESKGLDVPHPTQFSYTHVFDLETIRLEPGQQVQYYFEVHDNDAIHGAKASRTPVMLFRKPTAEEFARQEEENNADIQQNLEKSLAESRKLQDDMKKLQAKLLQQKKPEWQDRKELEKLIDRHATLEEQMRDALEKFKENLENQQEHTQPSEELQQKQESVQKLFDELMSDEMKEMLQRMEEMLNNLEKEGAMEMMDKMQMNDEATEKELDRMLELFKQLEVEMAIEQAVEKLEKMAETQEKLSQESEKQAAPDENLEQRQDSLNQQFDKLEQEVQDMLKKNDQLERPKQMEGTQESMDKIQQDMKQGSDQLRQQQPKNASKSQKNAAQRMRDTAAQMSSQMQAGDMEQMQEDMAMLRQLLENLVTLSFDQESLIDAFRATEVTTPRYVSLVQDQFRIQQDFRVVEDTLHALSKRVTQIESFVVEKVADIKLNLKRSLTQLEERNKAVSADHQQRTMTYLNDLALMLSEVMNQMQQQMSSKMPGSQMCNKPGGNGSGKPGRIPMDKISQGQQELNQDMQQLLEKLRNGEPGKMSKEFAQMAARQAALRKALQDLGREKKEQGKGDPQLDRIGDDMNKIEIDLVNKRLNQETLQRQQDIATRLLEAERSERQRDQDTKRQAETARAQKRSMPPALEQYIRQREAEIEQYKSVSPDLNPYYKFLVEAYYQSLKKTN